MHQQTTWYSVHVYVRILGDLARTAAKTQQTSDIVSPLCDGHVAVMILVAMQCNAQKTFRTQTLTESVSRSSLVKKIKEERKKEAKSNLDSLQLGNFVYKRAISEGYSWTNRS